MESLASKTSNDFEFNGHPLRWCDAMDAHYWVMLPGGQFYGIYSVDGQAAIVTIEEYLHSAGLGCRNFRLTWKPKNATERVLKAWCKKWSKRVDAGYIN